MRFATCALLVACSSGKPHAVEDAKRPVAAGSDATRDDAAPAAVGPSATTGDVQVRIEWPEAPATVRASPGATRCGTPRLPQVAPSTTFGIGDVLVIIDGAPAMVGEVRVRLVDCAWSPRIAIGGSLVLDSAADRPAAVVLSSRLRAGDLRAKPEEATPLVPVLLPVAGHAVATALDAGVVYQLAADGKDPEVAWIVAAAGAITDAAGVVLVKDVSVGEHVVRAWLPPRAGLPARHATGKVMVAAGDLAELTLALEP